MFKNILPELIVQDALFSLDLVGVQPAIARFLMMSEFQDNCNIFLSSK
jgi:hypothetical protein